MLSDKINWNQVKKEFRRNQRVAIDGYLDVEFAEEIHRRAAGYGNYRLNFVLNNKNESWSSQRLSSLAPHERENLWNKIHEQAAIGQGFAYEGFMPNNLLIDADEKLSVITNLYSIWTGENHLDRIRQISGFGNINSVDGQITRFLPGHFLTRHRDTVPGKGRRLAYVLGLTKNWHPDWGGLLQFYRQNGTVFDTWIPSFNRLVLFDIDLIHAVTHVAPYARAPRISMTGWFMQSQSTVF